VYCTDTRCDILSTPSNGEISCSSGREGVGYEGDICNFACNTGYELTGSDIRDCQSDGSWSGSNPTCKKGNLLNSLLLKDYYILFCLRFYGA